jgi:hypothetical protein
MVRFVHEVVRHTKIHVRYNLLLSRELLYPLVPEVPDMVTFTVLCCPEPLIEPGILRTEFWNQFYKTV